MIPTPGSWGKLRYHLLHIWCRDSEADFHTLMSWFACLVQYPEEKPTAALVISGCKDSGKSIIMATIFERIFNHRYCCIHKVEFLTGRYSHVFMCNPLVVYEDAGISTGTKAGDRRFQKLLSEVPLVMLTNDDIEPHSDTRPDDIFVLSLNNEKAGDSAYFDALMDEINNGGREAFLHDLLHFEVEDHAHGDVPDKPFPYYLMNYELGA